MLKGQERKSKREGGVSKLHIGKERPAIQVGRAKAPFRELGQERQAVIMFRWGPRPVAGMLLTCALLFPPNCQHKGQ